MRKFENLEQLRAKIYTLTNNDLIDMLSEFSSDSPLTYIENSKELDNCQLVSIKDMLTERIIARFADAESKRQYETDDEFAARKIELLFNGVIDSKKNVAELLTRSHRYLVNEMFICAMYFIKKLASDYEQGIYDGRNEYACKKSYEIKQFFESQNI